MDNNYIELYSADDKEGVEIKGKDVIMLDAPEVRLSPDTPLLTNAQDIAGAINEIFQLDPGGGDEWVPPDEWLPVPEPGAYEMYFLIGFVDGDELCYRFHISRPSDLYTGIGPMTVDWGDGTVETCEDGRHSTEHTYSDVGMYLIKLTVTDDSCFLQKTWGGKYIGASYENVSLMAKLGAKIVVTTDNQYATMAAFQNHKALRQVKINNTEDTMHNNIFRDCYGLMNVEIAARLQDVPQYAFSQCHSLRRINADFSAVKTIGEEAFSNCYALKTANFPLVEIINKYTFYCCYSLQNVEISNAAEIASNAFYNCYSLKIINIPSAVSIGSYAFYNSKSLWEINLPSVTSISASAFQNSGLVTVSAPVCESVESYGFGNCHALTNAEFAEGCTFGDYCFNDTYIYPEII